MYGWIINIEDSSSYVIEKKMRLEYGRPTLSQ